MSSLGKNPPVNWYSHPRFGRTVTFWGSKSIARTTGSEDSSAITENRDAPRLVHGQPSHATELSSVDWSKQYFPNSPVFDAVTERFETDLNKHMQQGVSKE